MSGNLLKLISKHHPIEDPHPNSENSTAEKPKKVLQLDLGNGSQVHKALPGSSFNSLLLNRYKGGNDYVGWHADDEKLYGPTPQIASVSFGFKSAERCEGEPTSKRAKKLNNSDQHAFTLKHGSLLVMSGFTQREWLHSVPKRVKADSTRINLTFRHIRPRKLHAGAWMVKKLLVALQWKPVAFYM
ncbi:hypothetical protein SASPL_146633 [Salvia splendens]|uniref:Fe2OG dioxygenase domain-containing protein n=1 Tax=Salvia splendens TaxID=180675 RepID=A0A8X8WC86_SALSN|nr:hypothetical protein SASPL_146633 [Salvia splendens]